MILAGLARVAKLFVGIAVVSGAVALALGSLAGAGPARAVSLGWYSAGAIVLLFAFVTSSRGPTRADESGSWAPVSIRGRSLRWASRDEQNESLNVSAVLLGLGVGLIVIAVLVDPVHPLF